MRILQVNKYFYRKGGADIAFLSTSGLLKKMGHEVSFFSMKHSENISSDDDRYFVSNVDYEGRNPINAIKFAGKILYSFEARKKIKKLISDKRPELAHLHNIYHQISPSIIHSLKESNVPIVMTLHDYKMICASYLMLSGGKICEACKDGRYYHCLLKKCVKDSMSKSFLNMTEMYLHHKLLHIYELVDVFISPSRFLKNKLEEMGFKGDIACLPNAVDPAAYEPQYDYQENSIVYFGRLSREKGLSTLIEAMSGIKDVELKIIGEGPIREVLESKVKDLRLSNVKFLGYISGDGLKNEIKKSEFTVLPSECYENNPLTIIEGFSLGKPAVGSRIGGISELIADNETGLTFEPGNALDLKAKLIQLLRDPSKTKEMGTKARSFVESELNQEKHYQRLMNIYETALKRKKG